MRYLTLVLLMVSLSAEARSVLEWQKILNQPQFLKTFNRDIQVYHYGTLGEGKIKNGKCLEDECPEILSNENRDVKSYFKALSGAFKDLRNKHWTVGGGFYAAIDPIQSSEYGQNPKFAIEVNIKQGIQYLEGRTRVNGDSDGRSLSELIKEEVIDSKNPKELASFMSAIKALKVGIIAYTWNDAIVSACADEAFNDGRTPAFTFILPELADQLSFHLFTESTDAKDSATYLPFIQKALALTLSRKPEGLERFLQLIYYRFMDKVQMTTAIRAQAIHSSFGCTPEYPQEREFYFFLIDHPNYR